MRLGVTGVSVALGNSGFSINGKFGSSKDTLLISFCIAEITDDASSNGLTSPMAAALSLKAFLMSADIFIGLNTLLSIVFTSIPDSLPTEFLKDELDIFNTLAASISFLKFCLTPNKALLAFIYASTTSLASMGPPRKASLVNNCLDSLTPL